MELPQLRSWRLRRAMGQRDLAAASGVGASTISRLEGGLQAARPSTVRRLAKALDVEPSVLMTPTLSSQAETNAKDEK